MLHNAVQLRSVYGQKESSRGDWTNNEASCITKRLVRSKNANREIESCVAQVSLSKEQDAFEAKKTQLTEELTRMLQLIPNCLQVQ